MESALIASKVPTSEDALTAVLVDFLDDAQDLYLLRKIIEAARSIDQNGRPIPRNNLIIKSFDEFHLELWPSWQNAGEPDIVVRLLQQGQQIGLVVIEVKLDASKSGEDDPSGKELRDQLSRYARFALQNLPKNSAAQVIYLTPHAWPPVQELKRSWHSIRIHCNVNPSEVLHWLSWRDIDHIFSQSSCQSRYPRRMRRIRRLFAKLSLSHFAGWTISHSLSCLPESFPANNYWLQSNLRNIHWGISESPEPLPPVSIMYCPSRAGRHATWWKADNHPGFLPEWPLRNRQHITRAIIL